MKRRLSQFTVALGMVLMTLLAVPTALCFGLICLIRTAVDHLTTCLES